MAPGWLLGGSLALASVGPLASRRHGVRRAVAILLVALTGALSIREPLSRAADRSSDELRDVVVEARPCGSGPTGSGLVLCDVVPVADRRAEQVGLPARILISVEPGGADERALERVASRERIRIRLRVQPLWGSRNPGGRDTTRALRRRGIGARARLVDPALVVVVEARDGRAVRLPISLAAVRARLARRLAAAGHGGGLLAALAVGDRANLSETTRTAFSHLGIVHLLSVSGLHVAIAAGLAFTVLRTGLTGPLMRVGIADPRPALAFLSLAFAAGYGALAGLGVPVQRALWMAGILVVAFSTRRAWPVRHVVCIAISAVLAVDPGALFDAGAQLSFAAAGALVLAPRRATPPFEPGGLHGRVAAALRESLRTAAIALAATAPLLAAHGMRSGVWGLAVNVLAVPITGVLLMPLAAAATAWASLDESTLNLRVLGWLVAPAGWALDAVTELSRWLPVDPPSVPSSLSALAIGGLLSLVAIHARSEGRRFGLVIALTWWLRTSPIPDVDPPPPRLVVFDVGQGDAILLQGRSGSLLVDGGRRVPGLVEVGERIVVPGLAALGVEAVDVAVATHADVDHRGGLESVLARIPVGSLWLPPGGTSDPAFHALREIAARRGVSIEEVDSADASHALGDLGVDVLWPPPGAEDGSTNDRSIVLRIQIDGDRVLLTGDAGREVERQLLEQARDLRARVLKVGHHGSEGSSDPAFLDAVEAEIAAVSAACGARSGLPAAAVLRRLVASGSTIAWTGRDGAVIVPLGGRREDRSFRTWGVTRRCPGDPALRDSDGPNVAPRSTSD